MFRINKLTLSVLLTLSLASCANIDSSYRSTEQDYQRYVVSTAQYNINGNWWELYQDPQLNQLVEVALNNNLDLAKAAINVNKALYQANLLGANLVPQFNANTQSTAMKNIKRGGSSLINHSAGINITYTVDLWQRLAESADATQWLHQATAQDLYAARLSLINSVVNTYYTLAYLKDSIQVAQESVQYYKQINQVMGNKYRVGVVDQLSTAQAQQSVIYAENNLISLQTQLKNAEQTLRNLLNLTPNEPLVVTYPNILQVNTVGVNLDIPVSTIANRPDVKGAEFRLKAAFKDAKAMQKSWFPSITIGGSLGSQHVGKFNDAFNLNTAGGTLGINLPFLNWNSVKWNVKISEASYEQARLNFVQSITKALNEIDARYFNYQQTQHRFANVNQKYQYDKRISQYYKNRYDVGIVELKDWLQAINTEKASQLNILNAKYALIQSETAVYSAMGGYYSTKPLSATLQHTLSQTR